MEGRGGASLCIAEGTHTAGARLKGGGHIPRAPPSAQFEKVTQRRLEVNAHPILGPKGGKAHVARSHDTQQRVSSRSQSGGPSSLCPSLAPILA